MRAIITGATGFIGVALCRELLENGHDIVAVIRRDSLKAYKLLNLMEEKENYKFRLRIIESSLCNIHEVANDYRVQADIFYHLAWEGAAGTERENFDIQYTNIRYTIDAISTAKKCGCQVFIGAGSQAEYGVIRKLAKEGEVVQKPFMMYGAAKLASYEMGKLLAEQENIRFVWTRIYSVYGVGENPGTLINYILEMLKNNQTPEVSFCENMWNYMYITDCVRAFRILGECESSEGVYHIASDDSRKLKEFIEEILEIWGCGKVNYGGKKIDPNREFWLEPECERMKRLFKDSFISFRDGIEKKILEVERNVRIFKEN